MKRVIFAILMVLVVSGLSFASGSKEQAATGGKVSFSYMLPNPYYQWLLDLKWYPVLQEKTGVQIKLVNGGPRSNYYEKVDVQVGAGNLPDMLLLDAAQQSVYGQQGAFADWAPLISKDAPNVAKYIADHANYKQLITTGQNIWGLAAEYPKISNVTFYRSDMFKKAGITSDPTNIAEFTADLKKLKETYSNVANYFPFEGRDSFLKFLPVFHAQSYIDSNGKVHGIYANGVYTNGVGFDLKSSGFKQAIEWERSLYQQGLIDPEWIAGTQTEDSWQTKMLTGKGAISDDFPTRPAWFMGHVDASTYPNFQIAVMPYLKDANGNLVKRTASPLYPDGRYVAISAKTSSTVQAAIAKFENFLFSTEGINLVGLGVEGQSYKMVNGKPQFLVSWEKQATIQLGTPHWMIAADRMTFAMPVDNQWYYAFQAPIVSGFMSGYYAKYLKVVPEIKYSTALAQERTQLLAKVQPAVTAGLVKFIDGSEPMSNWGSFIASMDKLGYSKIVAIDQQAYDAMK